ncbi:MAG: protoporphyrinogen oxidase [Deltaproteobacteria bacterium]|nr:protoporphyrinogen oxidase [Deltaproteobacteria bacterium]
MSRTLVVGAGLGGLTVAHALKKRGQEVTVLEAGERAGGALGSIQRDGFLLDLGPNSFVDRDEAFRALVHELGLTVLPANPEAKARYVVRRGKLLPIPSKPPELLKSELLSGSGKLRALGELLLARRSKLADESLEEFGLRHVGREATERLLDAMQTGIYAGRIDELSVASTFPMLAELERSHRSLLLGMIRSRKSGAGAPRAGLSSFAGGMGELGTALAKSLGDALKLNESVNELVRRANHWTVRTAKNAFEAEQVILALHPRRTEQLLRPLDAPIAEALAAIPHAPMAVVHLGLPRDRIPHPLDGFGFLVPAVENRKVLGCIFSSAIFAGRAPEGMALLTVLLGGRRHPEVVDFDDRALTLLVRDELRTLLGLDAEPELTHVTRHSLGIPQYVVGHRARLETINGRLRGLPGLHLCGWGYEGVGVLDVFKSSQALAARLTGEAGRS